MAGVIVRSGRAAAVLVAAAAAVLLLGGCGGEEGSGGEQLTGAALVARGDELYHGEGTCQTCHGADLEGTSMGPSFLDATYAPDHHPDASFYAAVEDGVRPHHWDFGSMPALPHLDDDDVEAIVAYVRAEQREAGIG